MTATRTQSPINLISSTFTYFVYLNIYTQQKIPSDNIINAINTISQPVKNFRAFYEYVIFITMFRTHHLPNNQRVKTNSHNHNLFKNTLLSKLIYKTKFTNTKIYRY